MLTLVVRKRSEQAGEVRGKVDGKCRSSQEVDGISEVSLNMKS